MCKKSLILLFLAVVFSISAAQAANIVWVGFLGSTTANEDQKWIDLLEAQGHTIITQGSWQEIGDAEIATMNNADLVIFSTNGGMSSAFSTSADEANRWNSIEKPILSMNPAVARGSGNYWKWFPATTTANNIALSVIEADEPTHPVFDGVSLDASKRATIYTTTANGIYTVRGLDVGNGTLIAHKADDTLALIAYWEAGVETYSGSGVTPPAPRMFFGAAYYAQYNINTDGEIIFINAVNFLLGGLGSGATKPNPKNGASDISIDSILSWTSGPYAYTHNVFFGTDFNDVNDATVADPLSAIVSAGQTADANTFDPGRLQYGTTYYWRVDEANQPPDKTVYKGKIWSFTTELEGVELAVENVVGVEFNSTMDVYDNQEPNTTYNGVGLDDVNGTHSNDGLTMWVGASDIPGDVWLQYELDQVYKLYQLKIWNYNDITYKDFGAKDVNVLYSIDNVTWKALDEIQVFPMATGESTYKADIFVDMNGALAKYVKLSFLSSYFDGLYTGGISEIKFLVIPTRAAVPSPANNATNVNVDSILSWKAGRGAAVHKIYVSSDEDSVIDRNSNILSETTDPNYSIALDLGKTYYWRVDEVNEAEEYTIWDSPVWKFSTPQYILIDGFEIGYGNNVSTNAVFLTWKDGAELGDPSNGAYMGRKSEPYLQTINHSGGHSAPMQYDNTSLSYSEVKAETSKFAIGSDWSKGSPGILEIWFRADANDVNEPVSDKLYAAFNGGSRIYFNGDASAIRKTLWTNFEVPLAGVNLDNVTSVTIGVEKIGSTGGMGTIYIDDIRLGVLVAAVNPGTDNLIARYEMENNVNDSSGSGFNGTVFGTENGGLTYEAGKYGNALVFDGNNDYVSLPIGDAINTMESCTISTWVNYAGGGVWQRIYDFGTGTTNYMFMTPDQGTEYRAALLVNGNGEDYAAAGELSTGNWEHVAAVYDAVNSVLKIYRNGTLVGTDTSMRFAVKDLGVTTQNYLGKSQWADPAFKGKMDDFRIYDRALTDAEVKYLYKN